MKIRISRKVAEAIGLDEFEIFGFNKRSWGWKTKEMVLDIRTMERHKLDQLAALFANTKDVYGAKVILRDIEAWRDSGRQMGAQSKVPNVKMCEPMLMMFMQNVPGHRLYSNENGRWFSYVVSNISYHKKEVHGRGNDRWVDPEHVTLHTQFETFLGVEKVSHRLDADQINGLTVSEILESVGYVAETPELRAIYDKETARFKKVFSGVGKQYVYDGSAMYDAPSNTRYGSRRASMRVTGRVVVDIINESKAEEYDDDDDDSVPGFSTKAHVSDFWTHEVVNEETGQVERVGEPVDMPIHPYVKVFHLSKHMHFTVHVADLERYKYDTKLINKLVLDDKRKSLVKLLVDQRSSKYQDIIGAKSGGAIVLLCGKPGTGKTLTAEVFAESEKRALYSVQCSQLGVTPEQLEKELLTVLARAQRWKAVLLLDEADVYVHKRGSDINQNAMVGVFLRVLEYQNAVMFMTTNRAKDIDDAVASRCTAKLTYETPSEEDQRKIWRVLVDSAGAKMSDEAIADIAKHNPKLSGRDCKNLLKLAMLVTDKELTFETIQFVKQFKPT